MFRLLRMVLLGSVILWPGQGRAQEKKDDPKAAAIKEELRRLEGTWEVVSTTVDGKETPGPKTAPVSLTIKGQAWTVKHGDTVRGEGTFQIDRSGKVKKMDIFPSTGQHKGKTVPAIYELTDDEYRVCWVVPDKERPTDFSAGEGSGRHLVRYKRLKK